MAKGQLVLITGPHSTYEDGDVLMAYNSRRISHVHSEMICNPRIKGKRIGGFVGNKQPLAQIFCENTCEFKFEKISKTEVRKTRLSDMQELLITTNQDFVDFGLKTVRMDINLYINRRSVAKKKLLFGTKGREIWYGGNTFADNTNLNIIWTAIETHTPLRKINHQNYPGLNFKKYLIIDVVDFDDQTSGDLMSPLTDNTDPENIIVLKKRKTWSDWRKHFLVNTRDILDRKKTVDIRGLEFKRNIILDIKI